MLAYRVIIWSVRMLGCCTEQHILELTSYLFRSLLKLSSVMTDWVIGCGAEKVWLLNYTGPIDG